MDLGAVTPAQVWRRLYADFLMPSRLDDYRRLLGEALERGYSIGSVASLWESIRNGGPRKGERRLVLRHDLDSGLRNARAMWRIEQQLGVSGSYYFRLSTFDAEFAREIHRTGGEVSYHYEEIATVAKRRGLRTRGAVLAALPEVRELFRSNLQKLRSETGAPMKVVASHGDWINRRLGIPNWVLLEDRAFRGAVGIELEVYDSEILRHVSSRHSDLNYPGFWKGGAPADAIRSGAEVVYLLVHPRHWKVDRLDNLTQDVGRLFEGVRWML